MQYPFLEMSESVPALFAEVLLATLDFRLVGRFAPDIKRGGRPGPPPACKAKVVIEVDGGQHYSTQGAESDKHRVIHMRNLGLRVSRFSNINVLQNIDGVMEYIYEYLRFL